jgi:hypothetical protein
VSFRALNLSKTEEEAGLKVTAWKGSDSGSFEGGVIGSLRPRWLLSNVRRAFLVQRRAMRWELRQGAYLDCEASSHFCVRASLANSLRR